MRKFTYLGSIITSDGRAASDIKRRIGMAKDTFQKMESVLKNRQLSLETKRKVLECYVTPVLVYGCESWTISGEMERRIEAAEMWFYRRMLRISWIDRVTNEEVLRRIGAKRSLLHKIRKRQLEFLGHAMRKEGLEEQILTGMIEGKRSRGRQRLKYIECLGKWMNVESTDLLRTTKDVLKGHAT